MSPIKIDQIIRTQRKSLALIVQSDGKVVIRAPQHISQRKILEFVDQKASWVEDQLAQLKKLGKTNNHHKFLEGELFFFLGDQYPLVFKKNHKPPLSLETSFILNLDNQPKAKKLFEKWYRLQAAQLLPVRTADYAKQLGFHFTKVNITSARTRWGSCSSRGSINFSWRLIMAPLAVIDYVIIHELIHTQIPNHSKNFWSMVEKCMADYRDHRLWLKKNGILLRIE